MSNYLEHLESSDAVIEQLRVARRAAAPAAGSSSCSRTSASSAHAYWDFIDHRVALTERSLLEAAETRRAAHGRRSITRFLPYSTKGRLPSDPGLVRAYLAFRPAWRLLGRQTLFVGERPA